MAPPVFGLLGTCATQASMRLLFDLLLELQAAERQTKALQHEPVSPRACSEHAQVARWLRRKLPPDVLLAYDRLRRSEPQWLVSPELFAMAVLVEVFRPAILEHRFNEVFDAECSVYRRSAAEAAFPVRWPPAGRPALEPPLSIEWNRCVACGGSTFHSLGQRPTRETMLHLSLCEGCGLVFANPMMTDATKAKLQPDLRRLHRSRSSELSNERALQRSRKRAARWEYVIANQLRPGSRVLEIGAGDGALIELLLKHGHRPVAMDPDQGACEFLQRQFKIETIACRIEDARLEDWGEFDAVFMLNLIEHLEHPGTVLSHLAQSLGDGGLVAIETPNILRTKVGPRRIFSLPHNYYFSPASLLRLLARQGFEPMHCRTFHLDMFHVTARRSADAAACCPNSSGNAAAVCNAIQSHSWRYHLSGQFLLRKLPWLREWYLYGRYQDWHPQVERELADPSFRLPHREVLKRLLLSLLATVPA